MGTVTAFPTRNPTGPVAAPHDDTPGRAYLFRLADRECYAISSDADGDALPRRFFGYTDWLYVKPLDLVAGEHRVGFDVDHVLAEVRSNGYAILGSLFGPQ